MCQEDAIAQQIYLSPRMSAFIDLGPVGGTYLELGGSLPFLGWPYPLFHENLSRRRARLQREPSFTRQLAALTALLGTDELPRRQEGDHVGHFLGGPHPARRDRLEDGA